MQEYTLKLLGVKKMIICHTKPFSYEMTQSAYLQLKLIQKEDYTLAPDDVPRLVIDGKGCDGFQYAIGFSKARPDDIKVIFSSDDQLKLDQDSTEALILHVDPFSAYYTRRSCIDYVLDAYSNTDGFIVTNPDEHLYVGKFFKDESMNPDIQALLDEVALNANDNALLFEG